MPEPILTDDPTRLSLFPITYPALYEKYLVHIKMFWQPDEISFLEDVDDWRNKLTRAEREYISHVLAFFATSENNVLENIVVNFMRDVKVKEAQHFYCVQLFMESVHSLTYSRMIDVLISSFSDDPEAVVKEKARLFGAVEEIKSIKAKAQWAKNWIDNQETSFAERLVAFICVEGIGFISSFASIFWLKKRGIMPGLCMANEFISRDESLHREFGIVLYGLLQQKLPEKRVLEIVTSFVELEIDFVKESLSVDVLGMNANDMILYVKFVGDHLLQEFGMAPHYKVKNPFQWMANQAMHSKTNFFEKRVSAYQKSLTVKTFTTNLDVFGM